LGDFEQGLRGGEVGLGNEVSLMQLLRLGEILGRLCELGAAEEAAVPEPALVAV
jgi:hypothetical protein